MYERSLPFAIVHLDLDLRLDLKAQTLAGVATLDFARRAQHVATLDLDAVDFEILSVELRTSKGEVSKSEVSEKAASFKAADFSYDGATLNITIPKSATKGQVRVRYHAKPKRGLYFLAPDAIVKDRPLQVWSQCQDEDARHWFPSHDKPHAKMTFSLRVVVPKGFVALSNGEPVPNANGSRPSKKQKGPENVFAFRMAEPLPSYLVTLVVGRFEVIEDRPAQLSDGRSIPVRYYVPSGRAEDGKRAFGETPRMLELFSKLTGVPYPWSRYSQVVVSDFIFGGMENTTCTTMYEHVLLDKKAALDISSCDLVAHELAHQWFGDFVTCRDWSHAWLNEGFATFFEHVEREDRLGKDEYECGVLRDVESYLAEADGRYQRPVVCRDYMEPIDLFDRHLYEKGGLILHMLRRQLGEEVFWKGVASYLKAHQRGIVETTDLMRALEAASGLSLDRFFDQWVHRAGHPVLKVKVSYEHGLISVTARQTQKIEEGNAYAFPFEIEVLYKDGKLQRYSKDAIEAHETLVLPSKERPLYVAFDPDFKLTTSTSFEAPLDMLRHQLKKASSARLRLVAAAALDKKSDFITAKALHDVLAKEDETWMVRAECASALGVIGSTDALQFLTECVGIKHPKARRAVVAALGKFRKPEAAAALLKPAKRDASYLVEADAARALGATRQPNVERTLLPELDTASWADVKMGGVIDGLASLRERAPLDKLLERTRYGQPSRARRAAIRAVATIGEPRKVRPALEDLLDDADPHLRIDVISALRTLRDPRSRGAFRRRLERETDGRVTRRLREALRDFGSDSSSEQRKQADELEVLRRDLSELKARLAKLEAKPGASLGRKTRDAKAKNKR